MSKKKNPAAVSLGRLGGKARARKAPKKRLSEIGRKGAAARWKKTRKSKRP
jgi:general stress protein YciG